MSSAYGGFAQGFIAGFEMVDKAMDRKERRQAEIEEISRKRKLAQQQSEVNYSETIQNYRDSFEASSKSFYDTKNLNEARRIAKSQNQKIASVGTDIAHTGEKTQMMKDMTNSLIDNTSALPILHRTTMLNKKGNEESVVVPEILKAHPKWKEAYILGEDNQVWQKRIVDGEFSNENLMPTGIYNEASRFSEEDTTGRSPSDMKFAWNEYNSKLPSDKKVSLGWFKNNVWTPDDQKKATSRKPTSLDQKRDATQAMRIAEKNYKDNPTEENRIAFQDAKSIYTSTVQGKSQAAEDEDRSIGQTVNNFSNKLLSGEIEYDVDAAFANESKFKDTNMYGKSAKNLEDEFNNKLITLRQTEDLASRIDKAIQDGTFKSGVVESAKKLITSYTTEDFTRLIGLKRDEIMKEIGLEGEVGDSVATYLKSLSGTAASQAEFVRTLSNFVGSENMQEDTRNKKLQSFTSKKKRELDKMAKRMVKIGFTYTAGDYLYGSKVSKQLKPFSNISADKAGVQAILNRMKKENK